MDIKDKVEERLGDTIKECINNAFSDSAKDMKDLVEVQEEVLDSSSIFLILNLKKEVSANQEDIRKFADDIKGKLPQNVFVLIIPEQMGEFVVNRPKKVSFVFKDTLFDFVKRNYAIDEDPYQVFMKMMKDMAENSTGSAVDVVFEHCSFNTKIEC